MHIPFIGDWNIGMWMIPLFAFAVVATGNAVNLSDGLDGLAGGLVATSFASFAGSPCSKDSSELRRFASPFSERSLVTSGLIFSRRAS